MSDASKLFDEAEDLSPSDLFDQAEDHSVAEPTDTLGKLQHRIAKKLPSTNTGTDLTNKITKAEEYGSDVLDLAKMYGQGRAFGLADEIGGALSAGGDYLWNKIDPLDAELRKQGFKLDDPSISDLYRQNQQAIQKDIAESEERHPITGAISNLAGSFQTGGALGDAALGALGIGGKAAAGTQGAKRLMDIYRGEGLGKAIAEGTVRGIKGYGKTLPTMIPEIAAYSKEGGILNEDERQKLLEDEIGGLTFGAVAQGSLQGLGSIGAKPAGKFRETVREYVKDSPQLRQMKHAFDEYGKKLGVNPASESAIDRGVAGYEDGTKFSLLNTKRAENMANKVIDIDETLGKAVGDSIDSYTQKIDASDIKVNTEAIINKLKADIPSIDKDLNFKAMTDQILSRDFSTASARDLKNTIDDATSVINKVKSWTNPTPEQEEIIPILAKLRKDLNDRLKNTIPDYRMATERFKQFRTSYIEQPIKGGLSLTSEDVQYGSMKKGDEKLIKAYEDMIENASGASKATKGTEARFAKFGDVAKEFEESEKARIFSGSIEKSPVRPIEETLTEIKQFADDAAVRSNVRKTNEAQGGITHTLKDILLLGNTGRGAALQASYLGGKMSNKISTSYQNNPIKKVAAVLYNAPVETNLAFARKLKTVPALANYGDSLEQALLNNDRDKLKKIQFILMQNPSARMLIGHGTDEETPENNSGSYTPQQ